MSHSNTIFVLVLGFVVVAGFVFLFFFGTEDFLGVDKFVDGGESRAVKEAESGWMDFELENVLNGEKFKISDFRGKKVLLESFAVWCPTCTKQQEIIRNLHRDVGDSVVSVSLDTDSNEDADRVRIHAQSRGFDWRYSVSPTEFTQDLIGEFGPGIVSAPSVPMVLICEDGRFRKLGGGLKGVEELKEEIARGCV
jgi:thiol-disulfide isomerase/thioredoxin